MRRQFSLYGDRIVGRIIKALLALQPGQITGLIQIESAYTILRLSTHNVARKMTLEEVEVDLKVELQKEKYERLRSNFAKQLRVKAKVEEVG